MVEVYFRPDSWQQQNEARSAKTFKKGYSGFCKNEGLRSVKEAGPELIGYW